jgi:hypothetical protein
VRSRPLALLVPLLSLASVATGHARAEGPEPGPTRSAWLALAARAIDASEYRIAWQADASLADGRGAWHAVNRAQNLRTLFVAEGMRSTPRVAVGGRASAWSFGLTTVAWGRPGARAPVAAVEPSLAGDRVEYVRGPLTEWYRNDERGLEQGFTIAEPPPEGGPLRVEMRVEGTLVPRLAHGRDVVELVTARGEIALRLDTLHTFDATGRELPSAFEVRGSTIAISVEDRGAAYPIVIDPTVKNPAWTMLGVQLVSNFGYSVDGAGDVNGDGYDDVIVGAPYFDGGQLDEGRAFVFHGSSLGLELTPAWTADGIQAFANLGLSVAGAGDVNGDGYGDVIVGAPSYDQGQTNEGKALVYLGSPSGLGADASWVAEGNQAGAYFGFSVSDAGDVNGDGFGDVVVGAPRHANGQAEEGRAYVHLGGAAGLGAAPAWTGELNSVGAHFGASVAGAGDLNGDGFDDVLAGAPEYSAGQNAEGRAVLFLGSAGGVAVTASWGVESNQAGARYGNAVAGAGDVNGDGYGDMIVGAYLYDTPKIDDGRIFVYHGAAAGPLAIASWSAVAGQVGANLGTSVASAGDLNGDGFDDVVAGAFAYDDLYLNEGRAYAFEGSAAGLASTPAWVANGDQDGAYFGNAVACAGDVDGDGASDVIVGAPYLNGVSGDDGGAFVFLGTPAVAFGDLDGDGTVGAADLAILLGAWGESGVPSDLNGDGIVDPADLGLLLGAWTQ